MKQLKKENKTPLTVEIETELLQKVKDRTKEKGLKIRQVVEFYFEKFLAEKDEK